MPVCEIAIGIVANLLRGSARAVAACVIASYLRRYAFGKAERSLIVASRLIRLYGWVRSSERVDRGFGGAWRVSAWSV
jgi:hypothetical protein